MRDRSKVLRLLTDGWCAPGEQLIFLVGGEHKPGWFGATLGNTRQVPYLPQQDDGLQPPWPLVNARLSAGEFMADEWVHDPAVWGWFHTDNPGRAAAQCGDALSRGKHFSWLACSNRRLAVIVEADARADALKAAEQQKASEGEESSGLLGGLFGKGKAKGEDDQPRAPQHPAGPIETWWEIPIPHVGRFTSAERGRGGEPVEFFGIQFADNSVLEFRLINAPDLVETVYLNLR
ncbi:hypothetical protein AB0I53_01675 [Saccharopolyspora sp. NPDC050389]|uniref:hypothetical protein n=1 Tax=Saccharopolyspora sp. NPDC050389 TaxID=3155516 RepID=UPI003401FBBB